MSHPSSKEACSCDRRPFLGLVISDNTILDRIENRYPCRVCCKSRKFFCYSCFVCHPKLLDVIPNVSLPIEIDIIKHKQEIDGKSTSAHAAILSPNNVKVYTYPDIPDYDAEGIVLIFPSHSAIEIPQLFDPTVRNINAIKSNLIVEYPKGHNRSTLLKNIPITKCDVSEGSEYNFRVLEKLPITKAVFIDSTWNQSKGIYKDERIRKLPCVVLQNRISQFWRHQKGSPRWYLATIEAIHQFVLEVHLNAWGVNPAYGGLERCFTENSLARYKMLKSDNRKAYNGQYDDLLYFFEHMYKLIHTYYDHEDLYAYKRRMS